MWVIYPFKISDSECYELTKSSTDITEKPLTSEHEVQGTDVQGSSNFGPEKM